jgi:phosphopantetheinyl transferase
VQVFGAFLRKPPLCAVAPPSAEVGCDLETVEPRSPAFLADYFTDAEPNLVARTPAAMRDRVLTLLWSAKESALKALGSGLRLDTRSVDAAPVGSMLHGGKQPVERVTRSMPAP